MQYRQDIVTRMPIMLVESVTILIVTIQSIWHKSAADFLFWKCPPQICESRGATATYRRNYEMFSAFWSTSSPLTVGENTVQINA